MAASRSRGPTSGRHTISASELGEYSYCSRAWWYRHVLKLSPDDTDGRLAAGTRAHRLHGRGVALSRGLRAAAFALAVCALALILALIALK